MPKILMLGDFHYGSKNGNKILKKLLKKLLKERNYDKKITTINF